MEQWSDNLIGEMEEIQRENVKYTLSEVYDEVWADFLDESRKGEKRSDNDSEMRKRLNDMCNALFDCQYTEILIREGKGFVIGESTKLFLKLLLKSYAGSEGKK